MWSTSRLTQRELIWITRSNGDWLVWFCWAVPPWRRHNKPGTTEKAIAALEEKWTQSQKTNNPDLISAHWSDKLVSTGTDGTVSNRAKTLADAKATKYTSVDISDLHVTVVEGTAIASMVFDAKGTDEKGKPMDTHARWTDVWVRMPGTERGSASRRTDRTSRLDRQLRRIGRRLRGGRFCHYRMPPASTSGPKSTQSSANHRCRCAK